MWWVKPLVSMGMSAVAQSQQKSPPRYKRTDMEQQMVDDLEKQRRDGFNEADRLRTQSRPVLDIASDSKSASYGRAVGRGMEHSIITDELMRKIDRDTQSRIGQMSNQIALQNQQYKDSAQSKLHSFYQTEAQKERGADAEIHQFKNQQRQN